MATAMTCKVCITNHFSYIIIEKEELGALHFMLQENSPRIKLLFLTQFKLIDESEISINLTFNLI